MRLPRKRIIFAVGAVVALVVYWNWPRRDHWTREHPITKEAGVVLPTTVVGGDAAAKAPGFEVRKGLVFLPDGRSFAPAGVARAEGVAVADYDAAIRVACLQGIVVTRDLRDGTAFLRVEPKFYNWCGTCYRNRSRWAGSYFQVPLSEFLIVSGYATPIPDCPNTTSIERWRLEGLASGEVFMRPSRPTEVSTAQEAFRFDGMERSLEDPATLDGVLEMWKPAPI